MMAVGFVITGMLMH